jgi:hypothetical protein
MLGLFPHMKYLPWYALSELVDNSLQSYLTNRPRLQERHPAYRLIVRIDISNADGGRITVRDNAAGIAASDWERAFRVAEPPADARGLSQFGVGMKAACCWFAKRWTVRSKALGEANSRTVHFDVPRIVEQNDEALTVREEPAALDAHFTEIEMVSLNRPVQGRTLGKIRAYLGGIYRQFLRSDDLILTVNGQAVSYDEPAVLVAPRYNDPGGEPLTWRKPIYITLSSGRTIAGFGAIRDKGDTKQAGLALFYRGKVLTGSGEEFYKPVEIFGSGNSFQSQRLFGEFHMDDFDVTYTKDALVWHDEEDEFLSKLRETLETEPLPLIRQAREYRKREPEFSAVDEASRVAQSISDAFESAGFVLPAGTNATAAHEDRPADDSADGGEPIDSRRDDAGSTSADWDGGPSSGYTPRIVADRDLEVDYQGTRWKVRLRLVNDEATTDWLTVAAQASSEVRIVVNQAHPFMRAYCELPTQDLEPVWRVAIALGLAQEMARLGGARMPGLVTANVNRLLRDVLAHKS